MNIKKIVCLICATLLLISATACDLREFETGSESNSEAESSAPQTSESGSETSLIESPSSTEDQTTTDPLPTDAVTSTSTENSPDDSTTETATDSETQLSSESEADECPHEQLEWEITLSPTCSSTGSRNALCLDCGKVTKTETIDLLPHTEEIINGFAPTCTKEGLTDGKKCSVCGTVLLAQITIQKTSHKEIVIKGTQPTCTESGLTDGKKCSVCNTVLLEQTTIPPAGHTEEMVSGYAPTCTAEGMTDGKKCSVCDTVLLEQTVIPKTKHNEVIVAGSQPTCNKEGMTDGKKCSVCDTVLLEQTVIPKINHTEKIVKGYQPTCTESGMTDSKTCSVCGTVLTAAEVIPALEHSERDWIIDVPAQSDAEGSKHTECTRCGELIRTASIPKTDSDHVHVGKEWLVSVPATCTKEGERRYVCECGETVETEAIPCIPHTEITISAVSATCSSEGLTEGKQCSVCNKILVEQKAVSKLPHTEITLTAVASTCTSEGLTEGKQCSVCKEILVKQKAIEKVPHSEVTLTAIAPTCSSKGLTEGKQCSVCKEILVAQEVIETTPHTEVILPAIAATCTSSGLTEGKKCSVCSTVILEQTPTAKVAHTEKTILGKPATCTESGISDGKVCTVCSTTIATQLYLPPTGHNFENGVCTGCGETEEYGIWIVDGLGNPLSDIIIKVFKDGNQIKMYQYKGEYLTLDIARGNYTIELDLSMLKKSYDYDESLLVLTPDKKNTTIRLFEALPEPSDTGFVGYPIEKDYDLHQISVGSYFVQLTPNDYTFFIFRPTTAAIYTITYESDSELKVSYHGSSFYIQGSDISDSTNTMSVYENGLSFSVYSGNIGGDMVFAVWSSNAKSCVLNVENVGDPGTRLEDEPWTPYLEDDATINKQLAESKDGTYTAIDLTDMSVSAVFNAVDGYYHLGSVDGPIIFIDLTTDSKYISSIQTICANQRMGAYIYDDSGKVAEKRSYNELFTQYGMPSDTTPVDEPIRIPLTKKLAEAIQEFGGRSGWWGENPDINIFTRVLLGTPYNQEYAWLLYCGIYE